MGEARWEGRFVKGNARVRSGRGRMAISESFADRKGERQRGREVGR